MGVKYSFSRYVIAVPVVAAMLVLPVACNDDFGYHNIEGQPIGFKLTAPATWHDGMSVNDNAPDTRCTSVQALSGGDTKLYLHTVVADNPSEEKVAGTRGTPVNNRDAFIEACPQFSLSGICYTGEYPTDEGNNPWTTEYAYDLYYSTSSGMPVDGGRQLLWPSNGKVRFFAFAPTVKDFENKVGSDGSLKLSEASVSGSPTLTYTVPKNVKKQVDLMTVCHDARGATTSDVNVSLEFGHALTAVQIKCGKDMLAGKITKVTIAGVHGTGTQVIGSDTWTLTEETSNYTISDEIPLSPGAGEGVTDKIHAPLGTPIAGTKKDNRTFMLLPQTVPPGATLIIEFTDYATNTSRTLTGSIAGHEWKAGKIVTYSISPSSINIKAVVNFSKKDGDVIPYSGVWYDATYTASAEIVQAGVETKEIDDIPADKVKKIEYSFDNKNWAKCETDATGLLTIPAQDAYKDMKKGFTSGEIGKGSPQPLPSAEYGNGETANCYLVDQAGYYSLPLVYGNGTGYKDDSGSDGLTYYPAHDNTTHISSSTISPVGDAVLLWQDSPDLIDPASVKVNDSKDKLEFHIRERTLAQGNAVVAVRDNSKKILWSWHIWVTPHKKDFYSYKWTSTDGTYSYDLAKYNLGYCDPHADTNPERTFTLQAVIDMSAYGGSSTTRVDIPGTFTQMEFKGSAAGDNTYYQWGRKDPMLGGIYNEKTPKYEYTKYKKDSNTGDVTYVTDKHEFTMENKQVFNEYNQDGYNYSFCKNPGDMVERNGEASKGVSIGYAIQHPYMFVTNSKYHDLDQSGFDYRNHWHIPYKDYTGGIPYLNSSTHIMFNVWNVDASGPGLEYNKITDSNAQMPYNAGSVTKSVYDPCPPGFKVPPIHAFKIIVDAKTADNPEYSDNARIMKDKNGKEIIFPLTGVRNYALRSVEWNTVVLPSPITAENFYRTSMPAFNMLTFLSSATIVAKGEYNAYQVYILIIDKNKRDDPHSQSNFKMSYTPSSNSYGLSVRPMHD